MGRQRQNRQGYPLPGKKLQAAVSIISIINVEWKCGKFSRSSCLIEV